jgi:hypothetical protein
MLQNMPLTGPGLDVFPIMAWHFYPGYLIGPEPHAHNLYLQLALDLGLPGLAAFLTLMVAAGAMAVRCMRRTGDPTLRALAAGSAAGIAAYLGAGLIDTPWASKPGILLFVLLGVLAATQRLAGGTAGAPAAASLRRRATSALVWGLPALLVAGAMLLVPGVLPRNTGLLAAQKLLLAARAGEPVARADWEQAAAQLRQVTGTAETATASGSPHPFARLASVYAWQGDYAAALGALDGQVQADGREPMTRYAPFEAWRRRLAGAPPGDPWADLLDVYGQWMARFPERAENYAAAAAVYAWRLDDSAGARQVLEKGLRAGAQPAGLLTYFMAQLPASG